MSAQSGGRNIRSWTDDQLRTAVASHRSWRGVARALGLSATSTTNVRHHVVRLGLDTTHFTGRRPWSDQQLRRAVSDASSWVGVLHNLKVADSGTARVRIRGHARRLGLDCSHLEPTPVNRPSVADVAAVSPRPSMLRRAAPYLAVVWFTLRGYAVALPTEPQAYDLLVTLPDGIRRVQVKSTTRRSRNGSWQAKIGHRPYSLDRSAGKAPYDPGRLDFFFVVGGDGGLYLIPSRVLAGRLEVTLDHYLDYRVGQARDLLGWAGGAMPVSS